MVGEPLIAERSEVKVEISAEDPAADVDALIKAATAGSAVANSLIRGVPVRIARAT